MRKTILRSFATLLFVIVFTASLLSAGAQQGGTTTYVYDDNGRLHAVIAPNGEAVVYEYDAAGNITAIRRLAADSLAILSFSPREGLPGDQVVFTGTGFGGGVTNVSFNGAAAVVVSVTPSRVVATVPQAATTGLVTITTPSGSVSTVTPFTVAGLRITPSFAAIKFGESVQFTAEVLPATIDQTVAWSVEGVNSGNAIVGTVSTGGLYTAPNTRFSSLTIRATSVADSSRFAEAHVRVSDPNDVQTVLSSSVSVSRGENVGTTTLARPVAVQHGISGDSQTGLAKPVAVQYGLSGDSQAALVAAVAVQHGDVANTGAALSAGVSVQRGALTQSTALSKPVSVQFNTAPLQHAALDAVSATRGPYIQSLSPGNISRGTTVTLTVSGVGLAGATALRFITSSGTTDTTIGVSNLVASGDGSSLTATLTVAAGSALGSRTVFISTPNGDTITVNLGINIINVQ
ncbi:MAG TPA: RHS repeat domain-containing protein [Pyrinomonadaceae bacterium]|nr:RHS repeat domain-containing protein [Pyrinomonadaceae bacterium]